ncbi:MAG: HAD family hydrolase [bacterium]
MIRPTALFWDLGGVILTDSWDRAARERAVERFGLVAEDFARRHSQSAASFEKGELNLSQYLSRTVFYRRRSFSRKRFQEFMFSQSRLIPETLEIVSALARSRKYLQAALNNESLELNLYRIRRFHLRQYFSVFISSSFVGIQKPHRGIFELALELTARLPAESIFIDDRMSNVKTAKRVGMRAIRYRDPVQLRKALHELGIRA